MPTADEDCGNACGYIEEINVAATTTVHRPRKSGDTSGAATVGPVVTRKYCILKAGHGGGHSFRVQ